MSPFGIIDAHAERDVDDAALGLKARRSAAEGSLRGRCLTMLSLSLVPKSR